METFDEFFNNNNNDFVDLPNELLEPSSYFRVATPIRSPDYNSQMNQILTQPVQIPTEIKNTQEVETPITTDDQKPKVLKTLDSNANSTSSNGRPKRAAALAANTSICSMKRKISNYTNNNQENEYDKENVDLGDQKLRAKQIKRRKTNSKITKPEIQDKSQNISRSEDVSSENLELKESEVVNFLTERKSLVQKNPILNQIVHLDKNQNVNMTLQLSCESDPEYDFNNNLVEKNEQDDYNSKLLYPNLSNPKLSDFVVNNKIQNNCENSNPTSVLHTPVKIDKSAVYTVSDNLYYDDSIYEKDELGFTLTRAVEPDLEQHKTHLEYQMEVENEIQTLIQESNIQVKDENNNFKNTEKTMMYEGVDLLNLDSGKSSDELIGFAFNVSKILFSIEELVEGIFPTENGTSRSKNRLPLDNHRTQILKEAIIKKFNYDPNLTEKIWKSIRSDLNRKLGSFRK